MARFNVSRRARADLAELLSHLTKEAGFRVASEYRERFRVLYRILAEQPGVGSPRKALGCNVRMGIVAPLSRPISS